MISGLEEGCAKACSTQCLTLCSKVYEERGLAASKECYLNCQKKCLDNCVASTSHINSEEIVRQAMAK